MDADSEEEEVAITHSGQLGVLSTLGLMAVIMGITIRVKTFKPILLRFLVRVVSAGSPPRAHLTGPWEIFRVVANKSPRRAW